MSVVGDKQGHAPCKSLQLLQILFVSVESHEDYKAVTMLR